MDRLEATIHDRNVNRPRGSYSARLYDAGRPGILGKFGEEAVEVMVAADHESTSALAHEVADLWFHSLLLLEERGLSATSVLGELRRRQHPSDSPG